MVKCEWKGIARREGHILVVALRSGGMSEEVARGMAAIIRSVSDVFLLVFVRHARVFAGH